jgi:hypothetical protein
MILRLFSNSETADKIERWSWRNLLSIYIQAKQQVKFRWLDAETGQDGFSSNSEIIMTSLIKVGQLLSILLTSVIEFCDEYTHIYIFMLWKETMLL